MSAKTPKTIKTTNKGGPLVPIDNRVKAPKGLSKLPDKTDYYLGGIMLPQDPDIYDDELEQATEIARTQVTRCANGLRPKHDLIARLMARGVTGNDAYRAAYGNRGRTPQQIASHVGTLLTRGSRLRHAIHDYRIAYEAKAKQNAVEMVDFVKGRLVTEAQDAPQAQSRIRALELLGKTEGMFIDTKRTERVINPQDLENAKAQLEQRLRLVLSRMMPASLTDLGANSSADRNGNSPGTEELNPPDPTVPQPPLNADGTMPENFILSPSNDGSHSGNIPPVVPPEESCDFSGPLILHGGLKD